MLLDNVHIAIGNTDSHPKDDTVVMEMHAIKKATGIPPHVMLLANMQIVISSQHKFIDEMWSAINEEFYKRHMASDSFEAKN